LKNGTPLVWTDLDTLDAFQHPDIVAMHGRRNCEGDGRRYRYERPTPEQEHEIQETLRRMRQADRQRLQDLDEALRHDAERKRLAGVVSREVVLAFLEGVSNGQN
jgi:hypothetical protein